MKQRIIISVGVIGVLLYFTGLAVDNYILRIATKPLPLVALLLLLKPYTHFRKYIFTGLVFSLLGDILLESSSSMFIFGLSAFLMGHIAYIVAFTGRSHKIDLLSLGLLIVSGIIIYLVLYLDVIDNLEFTGARPPYQSVRISRPEPVPALKPHENSQNKMVHP